ncbi:latent-transforming growth factor beta-binding protein 2-like isoform X2 [Lingula anatina]|nr:latent-transforming growth factor beta-binding protein 2-like isoform X2 [Lingula anatina]|eukprot:XP_013395772.1 latent-transforming growth factor beta-binding protein 2-like isoform X2 [Lingula anatina]
MDEWQVLQVDSDSDESKQWQKVQVLSVFQTCTLESGQENWLVSPPIPLPPELPLGALLPLRIRVSFLMHACNYTRYSLDECKNYIQLYAGYFPPGTNSTNASSLDAVNFIQDIQLRSPGAPDSVDVVYNVTAARAQGSVTDQIRIALRDPGSCTQGLFVSVAYFICMPIQGVLVSFPKSFPSSSPVQGSCISGSHPSNPPLQRVCSFDGSWSPQNGRCVCKPGYKRTATGCVETSPCESYPCFNGGTCLEENGGFRCECSVGFVGQTCENANGPCFRNPCLYGQCSQSGMDGYSCYCQDGWMGTNCDQEDHCFGQECSGNGYCLNKQNTYSCQCQLGFIGRNCQDRVCDLATCYNGGSCIPDSDAPDGYKCQCTEDFEGLQCLDRIQRCTYTVSVKTSRAVGAGTDERVDVTLGVQKFGKLKRAQFEVQGNFESGNLDTVTKTLPLCGSLRQIEIHLRQEKINYVNNWKLRQVTVTVDDNIIRKIYVCYFNTWFRPGDYKNRACSLL